ncbi:hypothetical protein Tco_0506500 [Tanacetum coccineum]
MHTRSQSRNLHHQQHQAPPPVVEQFNLEEPIENPDPLAPMDDNRTMAQLLEAPTAGYEDAIVVPEITADNFELKHGCLTTFKTSNSLDMTKKILMPTSDISTRSLHDEVPESPTPLVNVYREKYSKYVSQAAAAKLLPRILRLSSPIFKSNLTSTVFSSSKQSLSAKSRKQSESLQPKQGNFNQATSFPTPGSQGQIYRPQVVQPQLISSRLIRLSPQISGV